MISTIRRSCKADPHHLRHAQRISPDADGHVRAIAPFRSLATPIADMVKPGPYLSMYPPEDPNYRSTAVAKTMFVNRIDLPAARTIHEYLSKSDATIRVAQL